MKEVATNGSNSTPYASLFNDAIVFAKNVAASDIHIEPTKNGILIRIRKDGELRDWKNLPIDYRRSFIQEVKRLSNLSIAISNRPQDARLSFPHLNLALRVNSTPMLYGEKIVLRLLDLSTKFDFRSSNIDEDCVKDIKLALQIKNGVIIVSGPTGSGKTRTLYTLLNSIDKQQKNIVTLEDPIEYTFERINQIEIDQQRLNFSDGLRAILRQDPDVILVGEIRDFETADLCFKAAATGHLVISSLHANSSTSAVDRLLNLGVDQYMIESNLRFSAAQRLLKKICPKCSRDLKPEELEILKFGVGSNALESGNYRACNLNGCDTCDSGVSGRMPVIEYLTSDELVFSQRLVAKTSMQQAILNLANKGYVDFREALSAN